METNFIPYYAEPDSDINTWVQNSLSVASDQCFREESRTPPSHHRAQSIDLPEYDPPPKIRLQKHDLLSTTVDDPSFFEVMPVFMITAPRKKK